MVTVSWPSNLTNINGNNYAKLLSNGVLRKLPCWQGLLGHDGEGNPVNSDPGASSAANPSNPGSVAPLSQATGVTCTSCGDDIREGEPQLLCESGQCGENELYHNECGEKIDGKFHCTECCRVARVVHEGK